MQLEESLASACNEELDDMVLSLLSVDLPYNADYDSDHEDEEAPAPRRRAANREGAAKYLAGGNDFRRRPDVAAPFRDALMVYFAKCIELRTAPNALLFQHLRLCLARTGDHLLGLSNAPLPRTHAPHVPYHQRARRNKPQTLSHSRTRSRMRCREEKSTGGRGRGAGGRSAEVFAEDGGSREDEEKKDAVEEEGEEEEESDVIEDDDSEVLEETHQGLSIEHTDHTLLLAGCLFPRLPSVMAVASFVGSVYWLRKVDVSNNDLRSSGIALLCRALLSSRNTLDTLRLDHNQLANEHTAMAPAYDFSEMWDGQEDVAKAATALDSEGHLEFRGHKERHQGYLTKHFQERDRQRRRSREVQDIVQNSDSDDDSSAFRKQSDGGVQRRQRVAHADSQSNGEGRRGTEEEIQDTMNGAEELACLIEGHTSLTSLSLSNNVMGDECLSLVAEAACHASSLTYLDVSYNAQPSDRRGIGSHAGVSLKRLLLANTALTTLNLSWNALTASTCSLVAQGLAKNCVLTSLDLSWNSFGRSPAIKPLSFALSGKRTGGVEGSGSGLKYLDLSNNVIDIQGAYLLASGLESNRTLETLVLDKNHLTQTGARAIQMAGVRDDHAIKISMCDCGISQQNGHHFDPVEPAGTLHLAFF